MNNQSQQKPHSPPSTQEQIDLLTSYLMRDCGVKRELALLAGEDLRKHLNKFVERDPRTVDYHYVFAKGFLSALNAKEPYTLNPQRPSLRPGKDIMKNNIKRLKSKADAFQTVLDMLPQNLTPEQDEALFKLGILTAEL